MEVTADIPMALLTHTQLFTPHTCDDSFKIPVQLDEPIWLPKPCSEEINAELSSLCLHVEALLVSSSLHVKDRLAGRGGSRVNFKTNQHEEVLELVNKMHAIVMILHPTDTLLACLLHQGLGQTYPHLIQLLQHPEHIPTPKSLSSGPMEYFQHVSKLNNLMIMSQELNADNSTCSSHKYIAHQLALLHQTSNCLGDETLWAKREIQAHFDTVRGVCSQTSKKGVRLPLEEMQWIDKLTRGLYAQASSLPSQFLSHKAMDSMLSPLSNS